MNLRGRPIWAAALLSLSANTSAAQHGPYFEAQAFGFAEPLPVYRYADDFRGELRGGEDGVLFTGTELGYRYAAGSLALTSRRFYAVDANRDAVELHWRDRNQQPYPVGPTFSPDLEIVGLETTGLTFRYELQFGELELRPGLSLLEGTKLLDGSLRGQATASMPNRLDATLALDYYYGERERFFGRQVSLPTGYGWALDLAARWQWHPQWSMYADLRDATSQMYWQDAPFTTVQGSTTRGANAPPGAPLASGREGFRDFRQHLYPHGSAALTWTPARQRFDLELRLAVLEVVPALAWEPPAWNGWQLHTEWLPLHQALGLGLSWRGVSLRWTADRLDPQDAHLLDLRLSVFIPLGD